MPTLFKRANGIYYAVEKTEDGRRKWISTGERLKTKALKRLFELENNPRKCFPKVRLSQFAKEFLAYGSTIYSPGTLDIYRKTFDAFCRVAGDLNLLSITERHFDGFKSTRLREISPVTVNIELRTLRSAFYVAVRWKLIEKNPLTGIRLCRVDEQAPTYLTLVEFRKLMSAIKQEWLKNVILIAGLTGMRRGEIINLKWSDIDLSRRLIQIQSKDGFRSKCGKRRAIPMNKDVFSLLQSIALCRENDFVFTLSGKKIPERWATRLFKRYVRKLGLNEKLHFHSLRHSFATWLVQDGASIYEVQKLLGHSSIQTTEIYSHLATDELHRTVDRIHAELN